MKSLALNKFLWTLLIALFTYGNANSQNFNEIIKAVASDRGANDQFGFTVAISGKYAIVGAHLEDQDTNGSNTRSDAGSAYIYERTASGNWSKVQKIVASDRSAGDQFGVSVSLSGNYALVGANAEDHDTSGSNTLNNAGSAYIFERNASGNWNEIQKLVASDRGANDYFGYSASISGNYVIVGAWYEDHDTSGLNTLSAAGSVYIFERNTSGGWAEVEKIVTSDRGANDYFGGSVSLSGNYAIVGAWGEAHDTSGLNTLSNAGSAYIIERNASGKWLETQKLVASDRAANDYFATSVSLAGKYAIVGAAQEEHDTAGSNILSDAGSAYIFERNTSGKWIESQKIVASDRGANDRFGISVSLSGNYAIVGARLEDQDTSGANTLVNAGSAYIFERNASDNWSEIQKIVASDRGAHDWFGYSVSLSGKNAILGAQLEDQDTSGANTLNNAGSAYIFEGTLRAAILTQTNNECNGGNSGSLVVRAALGTGNYSYYWSSNDSTINTSFTNDTITGLVAGNYSVTVTDGIGDSSIVTAVITEPSLIASSLSVTSCNSYTWATNSTTYTLSGAYKDTLTSNVGSKCDSIVTLNLTINNSTNSSSSDTACNSYTWALNSTTYTSSGSYYDTLTNASNCDSIVTLNLTINNSTNSSFSDTACNSYTWALNGTTYTSSGSYYDTLINASNCDSIVTLNLMINNSNTGTHTISACSSYMYNGIMYTTSNSTALDTLTNALGCDSIVTLKLTINNSNSGVHTVTACDSYLFNGINYTSNNSTALDTLVNAVGCDSIVTLNLTINSSNSGVHTVTACDSYTFNGINYTANNNAALDTLTNATGCDSIVTLNLTINNSNTGIHTVSACNSFLFNGINYTSNNSSALDTLTNATGCDSIVTLNLTIDTVDVSVSSKGPDITANSVGASYQWLDCSNKYSIIPGDTLQKFTASSNGSYAVEVTKNVCVDTSKCIVITTIGMAGNSWRDAVLIYPNPVYSDQNKVNIELGDLNSVSIKVYSSNGAIIYEEENISNSRHQLELNVISGLYLIDLRAQGQIHRFKLVKN